MIVTSFLIIQYVRYCQQQVNDIPSLDCHPLSIVILSAAKDLLSMTSRLILSGSIDGFQFGPEFTRDRVLRQLQRLSEPLRTSDANNRGGDAGIAQRELQGRCCQGEAMALADLLHLPGASKELGRRLAIHIA